MTKTKTVIVTIVGLLALNACTPPAERSAMIQAKRQQKALVKAIEAEQLRELGREYIRQHPPLTYQQAMDRIEELERLERKAEEPRYEVPDYTGL